MEVKQKYFLGKYNMKSCKGKLWVFVKGLING